MHSPKQQLLHCVAQLRRQVQKLMDQGESAMLCFQPEAEKFAQVTAARVAAPAVMPTRPVLPPAPANAVAPGNELERLAQTVSQCRQCPLGASRKQTVFGEGDPQAALVFVGEAPGADEDREGRPFVGQAGKLLTKIIESIKLSREQVYICNILKCRPPGNRNPLLSEIAACRPYLEQQLGLLKPKLICALGTFAAQTLLATQEPIGNLRGKLFSFNGIPVIPTFHPAALLYHPQNKRLVWEDMQKIAKELTKS